MKKEIELEIRSEIKKNNFNRIFKELKRMGKIISKTKRLSVMFFGRIGNVEYDIRIRGTNGFYEIVIKKGEFHSHNRTEISQSINKDQFIGMTSIFNQMGFDSKIGERETYNFKLKRDVIISLVKARHISYIEIEKMSTKKTENKDREELLSIAKELNIEIISSSEEFNELCGRLTREVDWIFSGSKADFSKLKLALNKF